VIEKFKVLVFPKYKKEIFKIIFFIVLGMVIETVGIGLLYPLIKFFVQGKTSIEVMKLIPFTNETITNSNFTIYALIALTGFYFVKLLTILYIINYQNSFIFRVSSDLATELYRKILKGDFQSSISTETSLIVKKFQKDINYFNAFLLGLINLIADSVIVLAIVSFLFYLEPLGTASLFLILLLFGYLFNRLTRQKLKNYSEKRVDFENGISKLIVESLNGIIEIEIGNLHSQFISKMKKFNLSKLRVNSGITFLNQSPKYIFEFLIISVIMVFLIILKAQSYSSTVILSTLGIFIAATIRIIPSLNKIIQSIQNIQFYKNSVDIIYYELHIKKPIEKNTSKKITFKKKFEFKNVEFNYDDSNKLIDDLNFKIEKGEFIGVYGKSGSGKSTFLNLFTGLLFPKSGEIFIDEKKVNKLRNESWHQQIGYVTQSVFLINDTLCNNIAFGNRKVEINSNHLQNCMADSDLVEFVQNKGLEYIINENGKGLSGGQKQRISIARALYKNPEILIFDESTSSLDNESESQILQTIDKLKKRKTMIIVSHKLSNLKNCDRVFELKNNKIYLSK